MIFLGYPFHAFSFLALNITQVLALCGLAGAGWQAFRKDDAPLFLRLLLPALILLLPAAFLVNSGTGFLAIHAIGGLLTLIGFSGFFFGKPFRNPSSLGVKAAFAFLGFWLLSNTFWPLPLLDDSPANLWQAWIALVRIPPEPVEALLLLSFLIGMGSDWFIRQRRSGKVNRKFLMQLQVITGFICILIASGWFFMDQGRRQFEQRERNRILQAMHNGALSLSTREIQLLKGEPADHSHLSYRRLKSTLSDLRRINPESRFVYLMGLRQDSVFFYADSEPEDSPDISPPGQIYTDASETLMGVFRTRQATTEGPLPDAWGVWVSAFVPLIDNGQVVAVLGMDMDAKTWLTQIYQARFSALKVIWMGSLLFLGLFIYLRVTSATALQLLESEEKYRILFEQSGNSHFLLDDGIVDCNPAACRLFGVGPEGILHRTLDEFSPDIQPDGQGSSRRMQELVERAKNNGPQEFSWDFRNPDKSPLHAQILLSPVFVQGKQWILATVRDRTEEVRHREMERRMEIRISEIQKWEGLASLAGGVAHDFNNLINTIAGNVHMIQLECANPDPRLTDSLDAILESARVATDLSRQMLAYAGRSQLNLRVFSLSGLVRNMNKILRSATGTRVTLELKIPGEDLPVSGDPTQVQQVLLNLVMNAVESMDRRDGQIGIELASRKFTGEQMLECVCRDALLEGLYAVMTVRDNGQGMTPQVMARVFEPFFSTKFTGRGLGLAASLGIIHHHNGGFFVRSTPGVGSVFEVRLPLSDQPVETETLTPTDSPETTRPLHILVAEDEPRLLQLATRVLQKQGHTIISSENGEEALHLFHQHGTCLDLVFSDVMMPGLTGLELVEQIKQNRPDLPVILTSGHLPDQYGDAFRLADRFLQKPYHYKELLQKIHELFTKT